MASRDFSSRLVRRAARAGLFLHDDLTTRLVAFYQLLTRWNEKINLTSLGNPDEAIDRLLLEPLLTARHIPSSSRRLLDIGSGGGSPAVPLKLAIPGMALVMVESKARKSAFLREAVRQLELDETAVETARVEGLLARADLHERFDLVSLRAVRVEARMLHTAQAFLQPNGRILLFRGAAGKDEPDSVIPPLRWESTHPLVETLQSRLTVLLKTPVGAPLPT